MDINQYGLGRHIPEDVKRAVRENCGFGCVICGATIYEYEHFFPDFIDASSHKINSIALLCPNHHSEVTKGVLPKSVVASARQTPKAKENGFSTHSLPWFKSEEFAFKMGGLTVVQTPIPFVIKGDAPLIFSNMGSSAPLEISAEIKNPDGIGILQVTANEWRILNSAVDFEWKGNRYIFRDKKDIILQLRFEPANSLIVIEKMLTICGGSRIDVHEDSWSIDGKTMPTIFADYCGIGLCIN